jgi:hypothetical protein
MSAIDRNVPERSIAELALSPTGGHSSISDFVAGLNMKSSGRSTHLGSHGIRNLARR